MPIDGLYEAADNEIYGPEPAGGMVEVVGIVVDAVDVVGTVDVVVCVVTVVVVVVVPDWAPMFRVMGTAEA